MGIISKLFGFFSDGGGATIILALMLVALSMHSCNLAQDLDEQAKVITALAR